MKEDLKATVRFPVGISKERLLALLEEEHLTPWIDEDGTIRYTIHSVNCYSITWRFACKVVDGIVVSYTCT